MVKSRCYLGCEEENPIYFGFPTSRAKYKKWLNLMNITSKVTNDDVVCHRHFATTDYECVRGKVRLKRNVLPSLMLGEPKTDATTANINSETAQENSAIPKTDSTIDTEDKPPDNPTEIPPDKPDLSVSSNEDIAEKNIIEIADVSKHELNQQTKQNYSNRSNVLCSTRNSPKPQNNEQSVSRSQNPDEMKEDIEDIITNYQIRNKKPNKLVSPPRELEPPPEVVPVVEEPIQIEPVKEAEPVFIEIAVDQDPNSSNPSGGSRDCLMLLESVQVEVDPTSLLLPDRDEDDDFDDVQEVECSRKDDPISLVTSSDEDEVIIQEPQIDTVEVSSGTDEDDMPLVKLVKTKSKKKNYRNPANLAKIMWGLCEYYCLQCKFNTSSKTDYTRHLKNHETVLHICQICGYTTSSKPQYWRHKRKHKDEKRFKCHLCEYKARHSMSLVYHLKSHSRNIGIDCKKCGLYFIEKKNAVRHEDICVGKEKRHSCKVCQYATKRPADLRRHMRSRHGDDDTDYTPTYIVFYLPSPLS